MQTNFTPEQLKDTSIAMSNKILRSCVHCGFCTATCPTYQVLGDELDSPRGRIYLIKDMLENNRVPDEKTVKHIDRCLSCLACMTTCPSGVHYMHLIDHAREYIEQKYQRRWDDKLIRWMLALILPHPNRFRLAMFGANIAKPFAKILPKKLRSMVEFAPAKLPPRSPNDKPQVFPAQGERKKRVALMTGCAQKALNTDINDATIRILTRHGCEVVVAKGAGCCGALTHHMGKTSDSHKTAAKNIQAWTREMDNEGLDAIVINTSGCGTTIKDYGHMFKEHTLAKDAKRVSNIAKDISEVMMDLGLNAADKAKNLKVAYHAACSLQHGQQIKTHPKNLLKQAGFTVVEPAESHLCCGSAGTYNLMQPEISGQLKDRKVKHIEATKPQIIAAGNIGCMMQIGSATNIPIIHTIELLDWATGGPIPPAMNKEISAI
ncbi:MAG: glycolate oxidase iron-sulfur subunit [Hyphomicrobiales bacterium]|nr:MAG: glycolate oxidase iron-sulfur subunit [Hyphomicrobiales bacterium]